MSESSRVIGVFCVFALAALLFGCISAGGGGNSLTQFSLLKDRYSASVSLPLNNILLNDYISELSVLRGGASGGAAKVIDAELFSAQAFYYLNNAVSTASGFDPSRMSCSSKEVKSVIDSINLAKISDDKAIAVVSSLSAEENAYLRESQLSELNSFGEKISQLKAFFDKKC